MKSNLENYKYIDKSTHILFKEETTFVFAAAGIEMVFGENSFILNQGGMKYNFTKE